jgi:hypothetical protein
MLCPPHPPWLDHSNYTWRKVEVVKLLIMRFSPSSCASFCLLYLTALIILDEERFISFVPLS